MKPSIEYAQARDRASGWMLFKTRPDHDLSAETAAPGNVHAGTSPLDSRPTKRPSRTMPISMESRPVRRTVDSDCGHVIIGRRAGLRFFSDLATATPLLLLWGRQLY
jgi:hypothetical protein